MNVMLEGDVNSPDTNHWRVRNYRGNPQYYNPFKTYKPWPGNDKLGNPFVDATPNAAKYDPYGNTLGTIDLTAQLTSGNTVGGWTVPQAHTYLSTANPPADMGTTGRYYNSKWFPAMYYTWSDLNNNGVLDPGEGVRWEIRDPTGSCTPTDPSAKIPGCGGSNPTTYPSGRTYAAELQNFANWFQYSRTVLLSLQGAVGKQLDTLGSAKVGMVYLEKNISDPLSAPVADMAVPANLLSLRNKIYDINANLVDWRQPIHERMSHVFNYFKQSTTVNGVPPPIQYSCQQNFNVLATPGYLNENGPGATGFKNYFTGVTPSAPFPVGDYDSTGSGAGAQTVPYDDSGNPPGGSSYADTLADWSLYIYNQNLRPDLPAGQVPLTPTAHENNPNLHLTTYVIAPGSVPVLGGSPRYLNPSTVDPYTVSPSITWPQPVFVDQTTVDDLWHAAVNGRGVFVNDTDIYAGLSTVLNDVLARVGAAAAVAVSNANVSPGDNFSYASSYNSGNWAGDLQSYAIDLATGQPSTTPRWIPSAQAQLDTMVTTSSRNIATYDGGVGIPFQWTNLVTAGWSSLLNSPTTPPGPSDGANVVAFLRGDRSKEGTVYRTRAHVLGDIINAEPVIVREPLFNYADNFYSAYQAQYTSVTPRTKVIYQAANDGMVHAFNAGSGAEMWAYVPGLLFSSTLAAYPSTSTLTNLSMRSGFTHLYMVDGTPTDGDVDFGATRSGVAAGITSSMTSWHSILVGGLRKGGRGYYALDVTDPTAATDAAVAAKVLWEFPNAATSAAVKANIGYSYGKPIIAKTKAAGWVVLVTSGYNNGTNAGDSGGDGKGHLFVLDPRTGGLIADISTGVGTGTAPSGLAQISGWADNGNVDNTVTQVYGTDLLGNVWRFDLTAATIGGWPTTASLLATLVDANGVAQPITTVPELALASGKHMVFVGTGQYLGDPDVPGSASPNSTSSQVQTMYGLVDDLSTTISPLRSNLVQQTILTSSTTTGRTISVNAAAQKGWFVDLAFTGDPVGERVVTDPAIAKTTLVFTTNIPSLADPCHPGGSSWLYSLDYATGAQLPASVTSIAATYLGNTLASRPILVKLPNGTIVALVRKSDATTASTSVPTTPGTGGGRRVSWREILQ